MLNLSQRIIDAYEHNGLVTFFIYGKFADGKTSLLLHTLYDVYGYIHRLNDVDSWYMALNHVFFHPLEGLVYVQVYRQKHQNERVPLVGMDDVGQHIPRARWWREDVVQFREWMTVARTDCSAIGFTAPTQLSLPGGIIDSCFLRIKVERSREEPRMSVCKGYEIKLSPMFQQICTGPVFADTFPRHYPNYVHDEYQEMREKMVSPLRRQLISMFGEEGTIQRMRDMGATHEGIAQVMGKERSTITKQLQRMDNVK